jgi:hypothetical protein
MTGVANILNVLNQATDAEYDAGRNWYREANELAWDLSTHADVGSAAGVIAALSPRMPWGRNKELAVRAFADGRASGTLGNSVRAADRILAGEDPLDVLKGDKVRSFYLNILGDTDAVTVDRHALEVYLGKRFADKDRPAVGKRLYREVSDAYRTAASRPFAQSLTYADTGFAVGDLTPRDVQAITWLVWRRIHLTGTRYEHITRG